MFEDIKASLYKYIVSCKPTIYRYKMDNIEFVYLCIRSKDFAPISTISDYIHWAALAVWFFVFFITSMKSRKFEDLLHTYINLFNILHTNTLSKRFVIQNHQFIINKHKFEHSGHYSKKSLKISKLFYTNIFYHVIQRYIDMNWTKFEDLLHTYINLFNILHWNTTTPHGIKDLNLFWMYLCIVFIAVICITIKSHQSNQTHSTTWRTFIGCKYSSYFKNGDKIFRPNYT
jgi:hypothetical protein